MANNSENNEDPLVFLAGANAIANRALTDGDRGLQLSGLSVSGQVIEGAALRNANLTGVRFQRCRFAGLRLEDCALDNSTFEECDLTDATILRSDLSSMSMLRCRLDGAQFQDCKGLSIVRGLHSNKISSVERDVAYDERCARVLERYIPWHKLKAIGSLRLFLPSYAALILSVLAIGTMAQWNHFVDRLNAALAKLVATDALPPGVAELAADSIERAEPSGRHLLVIAASALLACGSSLFLLCPEVIQKFSLAEWEKMLGKASFEYYAQSWRSPRVRLVCAGCYAAGGALAITLLLDSIVRYTVFVLGAL